jgi:hypothetical protein
LEASTAKAKASDGRAHKSNVSKYRLTHLRAHPNGVN